MTRKRFIKLLMSQGVQRNDAEEYAQEGIKFVKDYDHLYVFALEMITELLFEDLVGIIEEFKKNCFPDGVPHGFPKFLIKEIQLN